MYIQSLTLPIVKNSHKTITTILFNMFCKNVLPLFCIKPSIIIIKMCTISF